MRGVRMAGLKQRRNSALDSMAERLENALKTSGAKENAQTYMMRGMRFAILAFVLFWLVWAIAIEEVMLGMALSMAVFAAVFSIWLYIPFMKQRAAGESVEKELPFALMGMAVELNMSVPFEKCIENASANKKYGVLSSEFKKVLYEVRECGASMQEALFGFAERAGSLIVKRAVTQLVSAYEQGSGSNAGQPLKMIAKEQFARQRAISKEFSGKLVVFSLMFIAVSAIVPALFQAFIVVGSTFMELDFTAGDVLLIAALGFPAIDIAVLAYIRGKTPAFLRG